MPKRTSSERKVFVGRLTGKIAATDALADVLPKDFFRKLGAPAISADWLVRGTKLRSRILDLEREAAATAFPPLRSLLSYVRFDARRTSMRLRVLERLLRGAEGLVDVHWEPLGTDPAADPLESKQTYLQGDVLQRGVVVSHGVDAVWAWTKPGGLGQGTTYADVEQGWLVGHEDLPPFNLVANDDLESSDNHGAAVLGIVAGSRGNGKGIAGIAPSVGSVQVASCWKQDGTAGAVEVAFALARLLDTGIMPDVVTIEHEGQSRLPSEYHLANLDAMRVATASGVTVVEAAGNLGQDLDFIHNGVYSLNVAAVDFEDSGAIVVGSCGSTSPHQRHAKSNHGSRIDCYGWGENVVTAGDSNWQVLEIDSYRRDFSGTSAAAAMVAGVALCVHGMHKAAGARAPLLPENLRTWLRDINVCEEVFPAAAPARRGIPDLKRIGTTHLGLAP